MFVNVGYCREGWLGRRSAAQGGPSQPILLAVWQRVLVFSTPLVWCLLINVNCLVQKVGAADGPMQLTSVSLPLHSSSRATGQSSELSTRPLLLDLPVIDGRQIACCAAREWLPAQVIYARARTIVQMYSEEDERTQQAARALSNFLCLQAKHQEDIGAASALRAYYTRIGIQEQVALLNESLTLINTEHQRQRQLMEGGLAAGADLTALDRRRIQVLDQQTQLRLQDRRLRGVLAEIAKCDYAVDEVRQELLEVYEASLDCDQLVQIALSSRRDLRGWIYLCGQVNETSAPIFAKMLATAMGSYGLPLPAGTGIKYLLCPPDYERLAADLRRELSLTVETHRRFISQAVKEKCANLQVAYERIALAQETLLSWQQRIDQLDQLEAQGDGLPEESAAARIGLITARAEEISRRMDARTAEVDLAESLGCLADLCCSGQPWLQTGY